MPQLTQTKQSGKLLAVLSEAAKPFRSPAFDRVREDQNLVKRVWSPEQIKDLCELVCSGHSLSELKDRFECDEAEVLSTIRDFGAWLAAAVGPGYTDLDAGSEEPQLFALPTDESPDGYVHDSLRTRNEGALKAITWHRPSLDIIKTYRLRQDNSGADTELLDSTVAAIAAFARQGRLDDVTLVNPKDDVFQKVLCEGYDVLEVYRQDAVSGIAVLAGLKEGVGGMANAVRMARPLFPSEARMMERALSTGSDLHIRKASSFIYDRLVSSPRDYAISGPHGLSIQQVIGICKEHGLLREHDHSAISKARALLTENGLANEVSFLLRSAVRAVEEGKEEEFLQTIGITA